MLSGHWLFAQAGLRESLERLDRNGNGSIEPSEITSLSRPFLERIAESRRLSLDRPNSISELLRTARIYHALKNGVSGAPIVPESKSSIRSFEPDEEQTLVPEFGLAEIKYQYTQDDVEEADQILRRYDENRDGVIDRAEAKDSKWTHNDPFEMDLDKDDRLSRMELTQRYARRRLLQDASLELIQRARRVGISVERPTEQPSGRYDRSSRSAAYYLAYTMLTHFDRNRNGTLDSREHDNMGLPSAQIDSDGDDVITRDELTEYLTEVQAAVETDGGDLPGWFQELDLDQDGQVAMAEFTEDWTDEKSLEFAALDSNNDGLLTPTEVSRSKSMMGGQFSNTTAEVLPPRKSVVSEIEITDDVVVGDLDVRLTITHSQTGNLDAYLTSPEGERVELFAEVGGSGDNFDRTVFDDQSQVPITKAQAPFQGSYLTTSALKQKPSLAQFNGKSAKGVWQLQVRGTRSERFGMLHSWSLNIRPAEDVAPGFAQTSSSISAPVELEVNDAGSNQSVARDNPTSLSPMIQTFKDKDRERFRDEFSDQIRKKDFQSEGALKFSKKFNEKPTGDRAAEKELRQLEKMNREARPDKPDKVKP